MRSVVFESNACKQLSVGRCFDKKLLWDCHCARKLHNVWSSDLNFIYLLCL